MRDGSRRAISFKLLLDCAPYICGDYNDQQHTTDPLFSRDQAGQWTLQTHFSTEMRKVGVKLALLKSCRKKCRLSEKRMLLLRSCHSASLDPKLICLETASTSVHTNLTPTRPLYFLCVNQNCGQTQNADPGLWLWIMKLLKR